MMKRMVGFGFSILEASVMLGVAGSVLSNRYSGYIQYLLAALSVIMGAIGINIIGGNIFIRDILLLSLFGLFCHILYSGSLQTKIFYLLIAHYICVASEGILSNIIMGLPENTVNILLNNIMIETAVSIFIRTLIILAGVLFANYINKLHPRLPTKYWVIMDVILIFIIEGMQAFAIVAMELQEINTELILYTSVISYAMFLVGIFVIYFLGKICWVYEKQTEYKLGQLRAAELKKIVSYQQQTTSEMKKIRHDIKKHLSNIFYMLETDKLEEAKNYITDLTGVVDTTNQNIFSGSYMIDAILNNHLALCKSKHIKLELAVDEISNITISPVDVSAILDNLLDNATEAVEGLPAEIQHILVKMFCYKENFTVIVKNPCKGQLRFKNGNIYTNKSERESHGYGLKSVRDAVERNNGFLKYYLEDGFFVVVFMLPLN